MVLVIFTEGRPMSESTEFCRMQFPARSKVIFEILNPMRFELLTFCTIGTQAPCGDNGPRASRDADQPRWPYRSKGEDAQATERLAEAILRWPKSGPRPGS